MPYLNPGRITINRMTKDKLEGVCERHPNIMKGCKSWNDLLYKIACILEEDAKDN